MLSSIWALRVIPFSKNTGSKGRMASDTSLLKSTISKFIFESELSTLASSSIFSIKPCICRDMVRMLAKNLRFFSSSYSWLCASSALVIITVSGVFNSWEASATNCFCSFHAKSTGCTAHLDSWMLIARKIKKLNPPIIKLVLIKLSRVASSLVMSANTR